MRTEAAMPAAATKRRESKKTRENRESDERYAARRAKWDAEEAERARIQALPPCPPAYIPEVACVCGKVSVISYRVPEPNGDLLPPERFCGRCYEARVYTRAASIRPSCRTYELEAEQLVNGSGTDLDGSRIAITRTRIVEFKRPMRLCDYGRDWAEEARRREWNTCDAEAMARHRVG